MIEFQLLSIWSKFHRRVIVSYYTHSCAFSNESGETEHSIQCMETSWKLKSPSCSTCHVASRAFCLGERDNKCHAAGGRVPTGSGHPHRTLYIYIYPVLVFKVLRLSLKPG